MEVLSWSDLINSNKTFFEEGSALTVGSFDGPHKGHESLFVSVLKEAAIGGYVPGIVTFTQALPGFKHPEDYAGDIATLDQRLSEYERRGFKFALVIDFDKAFSQIEGEKFFKILMEKLNLKCIVEGVDFRCGHMGAFNMERITAFALENGIQSVFLNLVQTEGERVSSSIIRRLVQKGDFAKVNELLERNFELIIDNEQLIIDNDSTVCEIPRSDFGQVMPVAGTYKVLINGDSEGLAEFFDDSVRVSCEKTLSQIKTITFVE